MIKSLIVAAVLAASTGPRIDTDTPSVAPSSTAKVAPTKGTKKELLDFASSKAAEVSKKKGKKITGKVLFSEDGAEAIVLFDEGDMQVGIIFVHQDGEWAIVPTAFRS